MVVQQWHYWKKVSFDQKKSTSGRGLKSWKNSASNFSLLTFRQIHMIFGHNSWFLEGTRLMRKKYLHSTLIAYQRVERTSKKVQDTFCLSAFFTATSLSPTTTKKNSISTILLSLSLFCLFVLLKNPFFFPFRVLASSAFTGRAILARITRTSLVHLLWAYPRPGMHCAFGPRHQFWTGLALGFFACRREERPNVMESILMNALFLLGSFCSSM